MDINAFLKKYNHIFAVGIFILLLLLSTLLYQENKITKEISKNCGWGEEDYKCFCEKGEFVRMENMLNKKLSGDIINVTLAG